MGTALNLVGFCDSSVILVIHLTQLTINEQLNMI